MQSIANSSFQSATNDPLYSSFVYNPLLTLASQSHRAHPDPTYLLPLVMTSPPQLFDLSWLDNATPNDPQGHTSAIHGPENGYPLPLDAPTLYGGPTPLFDLSWLDHPIPNVPQGHTTSGHANGYPIPLHAPTTYNLDSGLTPLFDISRFDYTTPSIHTVPHEPENSRPQSPYVPLHNPPRGPTPIPRRSVRPRTAPNKRQKRLNEFERFTRLQNDEDVTDFNEGEVLCAGCGGWTKLDTRNGATYYAGFWLKHKWICRSVIVSCRQIVSFGGTLFADLVCAGGGYAP